jgi:hypothetical protein
MPSTPVSQLLLPTLATLALAIPLAAAEQPTPATPAPAATDGTWLTRFAAENAWRFDPDLQRIDPWYPWQPDERGDAPAGPPSEPRQPVSDPLQQLAQTSSRVTRCLELHHWDEAIASAEAGLHLAAEQPRTPAIDRLAAEIAACRDQAREALAYDAAQQDFDALGIKLQGILWSDDNRLAMIAGDPRIFTVNDRVKDWAIVAIDRDRVVFRRHHYEFTCYLAPAAGRAAD